MDRVIQSRIQGLRRDLEILTMGKTDSVVDFAMKFTHIVSDLRNLGETMEEKEVVWRFLRATDKHKTAVVECTILRIKQNLYSTLRN